MLNKQKGEFNFNMFEDSGTKLQYRARYAGEDDEAIGGIHYTIVSITRSDKNKRYRLNKKIKALATSGSRFYIRHE